MTREKKINNTRRDNTKPPESINQGGSLEAMMELAKLAAIRDVANSEDYLPMTWLVEHGDGTLVGYITDMQETEQDDWMLAALKERFREMHVRRYIYVAECWMASDRDESSEMRPREHPDRSEVVIVIGVERGRRLTVLADIEQTDSGRQLKKFESCNVGGGWVMEMLPLDT